MDYLVVAREPERVGLALEAQVQGQQDGAGACIQRLPAPRGSSHLDPQALQRTQNGVAIEGGHLLTSCKLG